MLYLTLQVYVIWLNYFSRDPALKQKSRAPSNQISRAHYSPNNISRYISLTLVSSKVGEQRIREGLKLFELCTLRNYHFFLHVTKRIWFCQYSNRELVDDLFCINLKQFVLNWRFQWHLMTKSTCTRCMR